MAKRAPPNLSFLTTPAPAASPGTNLFERGTVPTYPVTLIHPDDLLDNPWQPRSTMDPDELEGLAAVIRDQGFSGVLIARTHPDLAGKYQIPWGHRRREAARGAGLAAIPVMVQPITDEDMIAYALTENIHRTDLNPLEEGRMYVVMHEEFGLTWEQVATEVKKTIGYVENRVRVARAPADVQQLIIRKPDSLRAVTNLIKIADAQERQELIQRLVAGEITTDDVATYKQLATQEAARITGRARGGPVPTATAPEAGLPPQEHGPASSGVGYPPATPRRATPAPELREDEAAARLGRAQLQRALNTFAKFAAGSAARDELSLAEYTLLQDLWSRVDALYQRYSPAND